MAENANQDEREAEKQTKNFPLFFPEQPATFPKQPLWEPAKLPVWQPSQLPETGPAPQIEWQPAEWPKYDANEI